MASFIQKFQQFMQGRNGVDKLTFGLLVIYCLFTCVKSFCRKNLVLYIILAVLQYALLAFAFYRVLSRNLEKRYKENLWFERLISAWKPHFDRFKLRVSYIKTHRFRTCKGCGEFLRLKRVRGKKEITCPKCGTPNRFFIMF